MKQPTIRMFSTDPKDEAIGRFGIFQPLGCWSKVDRNLKSEHFVRIFHRKLE